MKWTKACVYETLIELENQSDTTFPDKNPRFNEAPGALFFSFYGYKFCFQFLLVHNLYVTRDQKIFDHWIWGSHPVLIDFKNE